MDVVFNIIDGAAGFLPLIPLLAMILFVLVAGLIGLIRGLKKTVGQIVVIVVSFGLAIGSALLLCSPRIGALNFVFEKIIDLLMGMPRVAELLAIDSFVTVAEYFILMFISPFVFLLLFYVFRTILGLILRIVMKKIPIMNNLPKVADKLGGFGTGLVVGFLVFFLLAMPIVGTLNVVSGVVTDFTDVIVSFLPEDEKDTNVGALNVLDDVVDKGVCKGLRVMGGDALYKATSNKKYNGKTVSLENEIDGMSKLINSIMVLGEGLTEGGTKYADAFDSIAGSVEESPLIASVAADCVSTAAGKWNDGESFMGMESFSEGAGIVKPMMDAVLEVFHTTTGEHLPGDLHSIAAAFRVLDSHGIFEVMGNEQALLEKFNKTTVLKDLQASLHNNPRMAKVELEVSNLSMRVFATVVVIPDESHPDYEEYTELTQNIADSLNNTAGMTKEEKSETIKEEIKNAAADYDVEVEGEVVNQITDKFVEEFGDKENVTEQDIKDFIAKYQGTVSVE